MYKPVYSFIWINFDWSFELCLFFYFTRKQQNTYSLFRKEVNYIFKENKLDFLYYSKIFS